MSKPNSFFESCIFADGKTAIMIKAEDLRGTGVAVVTPFTRQGEVDFVALEGVVDYLIAGGVNYLVALGTTAETATLSEKEQEAVADCIYKRVAKRVPLVLGAGGNDTAAMLRRQQQNTWMQKFDALLVATPFYNKPNQEGLFQHYNAIAEASTLPIILYNVPSRTGVNMTAETTLRLANAFSNIIAVKEASSDLVQVNKIINEKPKHFEIISGDDTLALPMLSIGSIGVISVLANALPTEISILIKAGLEGDYAKAQECQKRIFTLSQVIFEEGNPVGIKAIMAEKELLENVLRLPLVAASDTLVAKLKLLVFQFSGNRH